MPYDAWYLMVNRLMVIFHYHGVSSDNRLLARLYASDLSILDCVDIIHKQWVMDGNGYAQKLLEQTKAGVTYTVWHKYLAENRGDTWF